MFFEIFYGFFKFFRLYLLYFVLILNNSQFKQKFIKFCLCFQFHSCYLNILFIHHPFSQQGLIYCYNTYYYSGYKAGKSYQGLKGRNCLVVYFLSVVGYYPIRNLLKISFFLYKLLIIITFITFFEDISIGGPPITFILGTVLIVFK